MGSVIVVAALVWLVSKKGIPSYVVAFFVLAAFSLFVRVVVLFRKPVASVGEMKLRAVGWFGGSTTIHLDQPMDIHSDKYGIQIVQDRKSIGLSAYVLGRTQFEEVLAVLPGHRT